MSEIVIVNKHCTTKNVYMYMYVDDVAAIAFICNNAV